MKQVGKRLGYWLPLALAISTGCGGNEDLSRAIDGGTGRQVSPPSVVPGQAAWIDVGSAQPGNDTLVLIPRSLCWLGSTLLVADAAHQRIEAFDTAGHHVRGFGRKGSGPGEFRRIMVLRCSPGGASVLAADPGLMRIQFFDQGGAYRHAVAAPPTPQGVPVVGEFALSDDGRWFDSWMSADPGPYLTGDEWEDVRLVRSWSPEGSRMGDFGRPLPYEDPVLQRVFNKVDFALHRDTLWILSQGSATVRAFDARGDTAGSRILLPVYHRGDDPMIEVKGGGPGFRSNRAIYQPNVAGLAVVHDSMFVTVRYRNWTLVDIERAKGQGFKDFWPESSIEVFDRRGRVAAAFGVPGRVSAIASDQRRHVAIFSEDLHTGATSVLLARLPALQPDGSPAPGQHSRRGAAGTLAQKNTR